MNIDLRKKFHKKVRKIIEDNRHIIELTLDVFHFYILPFIIVYSCYYSYWWWNESFIDHSKYVDIQFSLRGNTVSIEKNLKHTEKFYWLYEVDWPNRLIDIYQLDRDYKVYRRYSKYIYKHQRPDLICKNSEAWKLLKCDLNGKGLPVKFRNFFYREYCQNVHHYIREEFKENDKFLIYIKKFRKMNDFFSIKRRKELKLIKINYVKEKFYNPLFINDNYLEYKRKKGLFQYLNNRKDTFGNKLYIKLNKDSSYFERSNIIFNKNIEYILFNMYLKKFQINSFNEKSFPFDHLKSYNKLEKLKMCYNGENFFLPFDFEIKYLEHKKYKSDCYFEKKKKFNIFKKIRFCTLNKKFDWKEYYFNYLNFKTKKKLLLESRLRNRIYQEKLLNWSNGKRVPYKFKHDNLLNSKVFKTRAHYYDTYENINKDRKYSTNNLSISNWANNYYTQKKFIYHWDNYLRRNPKTRTVIIRGIKRIIREPHDAHHFYRSLKKDFFFLIDWKSRRRFHSKVAHAVHNKFLTFRRPIVRACLNINENLYELPFTEEYFKNNKYSKFNDKKFSLLDVNYKRKNILKTESIYYNKVSLPKKKKSLITTFPLRQKINVIMVYDRCIT